MLNERLETAAVHALCEPEGAPVLIGAQNGAQIGAQIGAQNRRGTQAASRNGLRSAPRCAAAARSAASSSTASASWAAVSGSSVGSSSLSSSSSIVRRSGTNSPPLIDVSGSGTQLSGPTEGLSHWIVAVDADSGLTVR